MINPLTCWRTQLLIQYIRNHPHINRTASYSWSNVPYNCMCGWWLELDRTRLGGWKWWKNENQSNTSSEFDSTISVSFFPFIPLSLEVSCKRIFRLKSLLERWSADRRRKYSLFAMGWSGNYPHPLRHKRTFLKDIQSTIRTNSDDGHDANR